jgi:hypothetical protein
MSDPKYNELALALKKAQTDIAELKANQFAIDNNHNKHAKDLQFLKNNVVNKAVVDPTTKFFRGDRSWQPVSAIVGGAKILILPAAPAAVADTIIQWMLDTDYASGNYMIRVVFPDGTDKGLYIPFSQL